MGQIFISHIEEEDTVATELARGLEEAGYSVWYYERDSLPGESYLYQIDQAISGCEAVLVVVSRKSVASQQIKKEIEWAADKYKHFMPVLLDLSWDELRDQRPPWLFAFGTTVGVPIPKSGVNAILPRILKGLESLGLTAAPQVTSGQKREVVPEVGQRAPAKSVKPTTVRRAEIPAPKPSVLKQPFAVTLRELRTLFGHTDYVLGVALSGDRRLAVSASRDKTLKMWEVESGRELHTLAGHTAGVCGVALSGDGRLAVSASGDHTLKMWEVESGRELRTLLGHTDGVNGVALSGDERLAVSASSDKKLKVWDVASGRELRTLQGHTDGVNGVAVSGDGRLAVSASSDQTLRVWEVESGRELRTLLGHTGGVLGVALSRNGRLALSASSDQTLKVWEGSGPRDPRTLHGHTDRIRGVALSGDGRLALSASRDTTLKAWDLGSGKLLATFDCQYAALCCACCNDGELIITGDSGGRIYFLRVEDHRSIKG
jgi:WD40 repeat protein